MSGHTKDLKRAFKMQIAKEIQRLRQEHQTSALELSAKTGIPEKTIRRLERTGNLDWFQLTCLLFALNKWIKVELIDSE